MISGIATQIENSTQGYFLTLTLVLKRFKSSIDFIKFIKYTVDETGLGKAQLKSERKSLALGRLLILSTILEAGVFQVDKSLTEAQLEELVKSFFYELSRLWNQQPSFRESILKVIEKAFDVLSTCNSKVHSTILSTLAQQVLLKPTEEFSEPAEVVKHKAATDADFLSLFILCKENLHKCGKDVKKNESLKVIDAWSIQDDSKATFKQMRKMFIEETVVQAFPRPHSSVKYLINNLAKAKANKCIKSLWKSLFEEYCFNENQLYAEDINRRAKISLNNLGFYAFQYLLDSEVNPEVVLSSLTPNFIRMWVNRMNKRSKNKLESVVALDTAFRNWIELNASKIPEKIKLELLKVLFGPNALRRFTLKHNLPLYALIAESLSEESIQNYITYAEDIFKNPNLNEFYPEEKENESSSEEDPEDVQKAQANKGDNIRVYVLNMLVNTINIFKNHSETTLKEIINFVVYQGFFQESLSDKMKEFAKDKLFTLVDNLHRRKSSVEFKDDITSQSLGLSFTNTFLESKTLWISEINKTIGRYALEGNEFNTLDQIDESEKDKKSKPKAKENKHALKLGKPNYNSLSFPNLR